MIRNPINLYPQNITVLPSETYLSFTFMGDRMFAYKINIYNYSVDSDDSEELVYDGDIIYPSSYIYNNTEVKLEASLSEMNVKNGRSYTWEVIMFPDASEVNSFKSLRYYFQTSSRPYVRTHDLWAGGEQVKNGFLINNKAYEYNPTKNNVFIDVIDLQDKNLTVEGYYYGGGTDEIKYYYFQLFDENNNMIEETDKIFSSKIEYNFSGLMSLKNYTLYFYSVSQKDLILKIGFNILTTYEIKENMNYPPVLSCNENEANVKIKWIKDSAAIGIPSGNFSFTEQGEVNIESGTLVYDNISSFPIAMNKDNFTVGVKTTINNNTMKIFDYINNDILYEIYLENYKIFLKYGSLNSSQKNIVEIANFKKDILFGVQDNSEPADDTGYMWYDNETFSADENQYLVISKYEEKKYNIILQNNNGEITCQIETIE